MEGLIEDLTGSLASAGIWTGVIGSLWALMQFLCAPVLGGLSDRYGRRLVMSIALVLQILSAAGILYFSWRYCYPKLYERGDRCGYRKGCSEAIA